MAKAKKKAVKKDVEVVAHSERVSENKEGYTVQYPDCGRGYTLEAYENKSSKATAPNSKGRLELFIDEMEAALEYAKDLGKLCTQKGENEDRPVMYVDISCWDGKTKKGGKRQSMTASTVKHAV